MAAGFASKRISSPALDGRFSCIDSAFGEAPDRCHHTTKLRPVSKAIAPVANGPTPSSLNLREITASSHQKRASLSMDGRFARKYDARCTEDRRASANSRQAQCVAATSLHDLTVQRRPRASDPRLAMSSAQLPSLSTMKSIEPQPSPFLSAIDKRLQIARTPAQQLASATHARATPGSAQSSRQHQYFFGSRTVSLPDEADEATGSATGSTVSESDDDACSSTSESVEVQTAGKSAALCCMLSFIEASQQETARLALLRAAAAEPCRSKQRGKGKHAPSATVQEFSRVADPSCYTEKRSSTASRGSKVVPAPQLETRTTVRGSLAATPDESVNAYKITVESIDELNKDRGCREILNAKQELEQVR